MQKLTLSFVNTIGNIPVVRIPLTSEKSIHRVHSVCPSTEWTPCQKVGEKLAAITCNPLTQADVW